MRRTVQRRTAVGFIALVALILPSALTAAASPPSRDDVIVLDGATSAEGIAAGEGRTFYAGDLMTGDIFRGDIREGKAKLFIDVPDGRMAVGMKADVDNDLLFVAGGSTGKAYVYNTETGKAADEVTLTTKANQFINDVTLTDRGAWFTNSAAAELYFVPVGRHGKLAGEIQTLPLTTGPASDAGDAFNLNGIASVQGGRVLIVAHSGNSQLYTVDPDTGESALIQGDKLPNIDGILVKGRTLWAVQNMSNQISRVKLSRDLSSFTVEEVITSGHFDIPTTVAKFGNTLAAVNAKFGAMPPATEYEVVLVPARD
jgi:hypothetical protein